MKVRLIYLAAGNSRRFGSNKLLHELNGKPLFQHLLERLTRICERHDEWEVIVVTQYQIVYDRAAEMGVHVVFSPESYKGASYSIRAGLAEAEGAEYCVFFVADQPYLTEAAAEGFLEEMERKQADLGCVVCGSHRGNPGWFSRKYFLELEALEGDQGGRKVLKAHQEEVLFFQIPDEHELEDIDVIADVCIV